MKPLKDCIDRQAGFTLIEVLVALALIFVFAAVLGPFMFQSRQILRQGDGQIRAELFLRSLLAAPFERSNPEVGIRQGETEGMRWRLDVQSMALDDWPEDIAAKDPKKPNWELFRIKASVLSEAGQILTAETSRLGIAK